MADPRTSLVALVLSSLLACAPAERRDTCSARCEDDKSAVDSGVSDASSDGGSADASSDGGSADAGSDGGRDAGLDAGTDGGADAGSTQGGDVLLFHGRAGVGPEGIFGYGAHHELTRLYETAGLDVAYTESWPTSLANHRFVLLAVPGYGDTAARFSAGEITQLKSFLASGGTVFVENEHGFYSGTATINDLLARLGSAVRQQDAKLGEGDFYGVLATDLASHPLVAAFDKLGFGDSSRVLVNGATCLVKWEADCVLALDTALGGRLVVSGDSQFLDDHGLVEYPRNGGDNVAFARRLALLE